MKYLNLGCGNHYSTKSEWTNLDFVSTGAGVIAHNLLNGIPFEENTFDAVYHSHVLEHFSKQDGEQFVKECFRVLKPGGVLRVAIPDLERIARNYLLYLEQGMNNPTDKMIRANYEWMKIEMYDQTVRNQSGGDMIKYLHQDKIINEDFVFERIGQEGRALRQQYLDSKNRIPVSRNVLRKILGNMKRFLQKTFYKAVKIDSNKYDIGSFRLGGEIHQWMYDRYSLTSLLSDNGGYKIMECTAFSSHISNWANYNIDGKENIIRKPDSLFIECVKK